MVFWCFPSAAVGAFAAALLLLAPEEAEACSCLDRPICDDINFASIVLHAKAIKRTEGNSSTELFSDVTYEVEINALYKVEENVSYGEQISFITSANSAFCGIYLEIGEEYLLDLYRPDDGSGLRAVGMCGAIQSWSSVTDEDLEILEESGCENDTDACGGLCGEFQECLAYAKDPTSSNLEEEESYCTDVCDPSPCEAGEVCSLESVTCVTTPCPPIATCASSVPTSTAGSDDNSNSDTDTDNCDGNCDDFQECRLYAEDGAEEYYCRDVCDPSPCDENEVCSFSDVVCAGPEYLCSPAAVCEPEDSDAVAMEAELEAELESEQTDLDSSRRLTVGSFGVGFVICFTACAQMLLGL